MAYRIVITDDDPLNLKAATHILTQNGFMVDCLRSGEELLEYVDKIKPDLILLDIHMVGMDGFETIKRLHARSTSESVPVIFLTADDEEDTEAKALSLGATDFVKKPFVSSILLLRVRNSIELFRLQRHLMDEVRKKTEEVVKEHERNERLSLQVVQTIAGAIDAKDKYTNGHSLRVAQYSREIARRAGYSKRAQNEIYMMGLLHDVGKIGIGDDIINKPSRLTVEEYDIIKTHPMVGFGILKNITELPMLAIGARWHHERYDGSGYPDGLKGNDIPEEARLIAVADAYDAMSSCRTYHESYDKEFVKNEFLKGRGVQFDPYFTDIMIEMISEDLRYNVEESLDRNEFEKLVIKRESSPEETLLSVLSAGGVDPKTGMRYCMNDTDFYTEMLTDFVDGAPQREQALMDFFSPLDTEGYRINSHSLKSASRTIGALELSKTAEQMENAARVNDTAFIYDNHYKLINDLGRTTGIIRTALALIAGGEDNHVTTNKDDE